MEKHIKRARFITNILDREFKFFGYKFGIDPLIGLIPILGDVLPFLFGFYFMWIGWKLKMPKKDISKMFANSTIDIILGLVPIVGDLTDVVYKANYKNLKLIEKHQKNIKTITN